MNEIRNIDVNLITEKIEQALIDVNINLSPDITDKIYSSSENETDPRAKFILNKMTENISAAKELNIPVCQDTGMAVIFMEIGQDVHFTGGNLEDAVNEGVRRGYINGYLRKSVVSDPLVRNNTNDNTPCVLHISIVSGSGVTIDVCPKGFGSENMSKIRMFNPSASKEDIIDFVVETVACAGSNPCPPVVVGVGIGGTFEKCALLSKKALTRNIDSENPDKFYADMENDIFDKINKTDIGPQGFGGDTTALGVNIETYPTHIAGLPVAVNVSCHVTRHKKIHI